MTTTAKKEKAQPVFKHRMAGFEGSVWKNSGDKSDFYSIQITRGFKNSKGEYRNTSSYSPNEVPIRRLVEDELLKYINDNPLP